MKQLKSYHRPVTVEAALQLLAQPEVKTTVIGGGTAVNAALDETVEAVVDLQAVGLDKIEHGAGHLTCGAMVRLHQLIDDEQIPALLRTMARREGPNTFRNAGTVGGVIVCGNPESELLAALLVIEAVVSVRTLTETRQVPLAEFLADVPGSLAGGLVTAVTAATGGRTAEARAARTPADSPIVAAVARRDDAGRIRLALCGVSATPILAAPDTLETALNPPADFRGSSHYRKSMAITLSRRVLAELAHE